MTQRVPAAARLGRTKSGLDIGYRVLDINRGTYTSFSREMVLETDIPGYYVVVGDVESPDEGGHVVWGTESKDMAESPIPPVPVDISQKLLTGIYTALQTTLERIRAMIPPPMQAPIVQMDTGAFESGVAKIHSHVAELVQASGDRHDIQIAKIHRQLDDLREIVQRLDKLNGAVEGFETLTAVSEQLNMFLGSYPGIGRLATLTATSPVDASTPDAATLRKLAQLQGEIERLNGTLTTVQEISRQSEAKRMAALEKLDGFLATVGGLDDDTG